MDGIKIFIWRKKELNDMKTILNKIEHNSILMVGDVWIGKTSILEKFIRDNGETYSFQTKDKFKMRVEEKLSTWITNINYDDIVLSKSEVFCFDDVSVKEIVEDFYLFNFLKNKKYKKILVLNYSQYSKIMQEEEWLLSWFEKIEVLPIKDNNEIKEELSQYIEEIQLKYEISFWLNVLDLIINLSQQYLSDAFMPYRILNVIDLIRSSMKEWELEMTEDNVYEYFWKLFWTSITFSRAKDDNEEAEKLLNFEKELGKQVIWHKKAIKSVANAIRIAKLGLLPKDKPLASFMFLWPTWVGKTELVKALSNALYGSDEILRFDCAEYSTKESIYKLIWPPAWLPWYEAGWVLVNAVRKKPFSIVLFDELEKSFGREWVNGSDLVDILLSVLDEGKMSDNKWNKVDFSNTIVIMTSNVGATTFKDSIEFWHRTKADKERLQWSAITWDLEKVFRPEFLNRIDEIITFWTLTREDVMEIVRLKLKWVWKILREKWISTTFDESFIDFIWTVGFDPTNGWRPINREIKKRLLPKLWQMMLKRELYAWDSIRILYSEWTQEITVEKE